MGDESIDIRVHNVVCCFSTRCHLDLRTFALHSANITYERGKGVAIKQLRKPHCQARIWSSGKAAIVGCKSEEDAFKSARAVARQLQKWIPKVKFTDYRVTNVLATCKLPWGIDLNKMASENPRQASYEPELNTGLIWRTEEPKSTLTVHTTGSITVTGANSVENVQLAMEQIYPVVSKYKVQPVAQPPEAKRERIYAGQSGFNHNTAKADSSKNFANWTNTAAVGQLHQINRVSQPQAYLGTNNGGTNGHRVVSISQSVLIAKRNVTEVVEIDDSSSDEFEDF